MDVLSVLVSSIPSEKYVFYPEISSILRYLMIREGGYRV